MEQSAEGPKNKERYVLEHLSYANRLAKKFYIENSSSLVDFDDVKSAAYLGLCDAAFRFDPAKGVSFKTFSFLRIRGEMYDLLRKAQPQPRRRSSDASETQAVHEHRMSCRRTNDIKPAAQVYEEMGLIVRINGGDQKLELSYLHQHSPDESSEHTSLRRHLLAVIARLPENEKRLIHLKYFHNHSYSDICRISEGVQKSWLSRLHKRAIGKLRKEIHCEEVYS